MTWYGCAKVFLLAGGISGLLMSAAHADDRVYFTSDRASTPGHPQTQVFAMNADGGEVRQLTSSHSIKAYATRCGAGGPVFFQSGDALARLNAAGEEEAYLAAKGVQYHSPRCSTDSHYLSVTAWDKAHKKGYIEVYKLADKQRLARWEGEQASWRRGRHEVIYRQVTKHGEGAKIDILARNLDAASSPRPLYHYVVGEAVYDITEPQFVGPGDNDFVFRVYDEHEYFYYLGEIGKSFILTRDKMPLGHHDVYTGAVAEPLEQGELKVAPDGLHAVMTEHQWNAPPSLYLVDMKTRDSWKIAEGYNPVWSGDSARVYFNKDPAHYVRYHEAQKSGADFDRIYPKVLEGYEIYVYDLAGKQEKRMTDNQVYDGFL